VHHAPLTDCLYVEGQCRPELYRLGDGGKFDLAMYRVGPIERSVVAPALRNGVESIVDELIGLNDQTEMAYESSVNTLTSLDAAAEAEMQECTRLLELQLTEVGADLGTRAGWMAKPKRVPEPRPEGVALGAGGDEALGEAAGGDEAAEMALAAWEEREAAAVAAEEEEEAAVAAFDPDAPDEPVDGETEEEAEVRRQLSQGMVPVRLSFLRPCFRRLRMTHLCLNSAASRIIHQQPVCRAHHRGHAAVGDDPTPGLNPDRRGGPRAQLHKGWPQPSEWGRARRLLLRFSHFHGPRIFVEEAPRGDGGAAEAME
jgi:hypothetical protein